MTSVVILIESADLKSGSCSDTCFDGVTSGCYQASTCRATNYAISVGVIISVVSLFAIGLTHYHQMFLPIEATLSIIALVFYTCGTGFITAENGPGNAMGNLYFTTWGGFIASFMLVGLCAKEYNEGRIDLTVTEPSESSTKQETEVTVEAPAEIPVASDIKNNEQDLEL